MEVHERTTTADTHLSILSLLSHPKPEWPSVLPLLPWKAVRRARCDHQRCPLEVSGNPTSAKPSPWATCTDSCGLGTGSTSWSSTRWSRCWRGQQEQRTSRDRGADCV